MDSAPRKLPHGNFCFLRCFVQSIVHTEQNRLAGQCNEKQKSLLPKTQGGWTVLRPEPARSSPGVCRALENRSLAEVCPAGSHAVLPAARQTHLGKQGGILEGVVSSNKPLRLTAACQSHSQMKLSQIQHHFVSSRRQMLPPTLSPPAPYHPSAYLENARGPIFPFSCDSQPVQRDSLSWTKSHTFPNMTLCQHPFMNELEGVSGISFKIKSRRHLRCCLDPS